MYYLYIIQCADGSLYTGITTDLKRRIDEHNNSAKGAKYTSARRPVKMVYFKEYKNRSIASKREHAIKQLSRKDKLELIRLGIVIPVEAGIQARIKTRISHQAPDDKLRSMTCKQFQKEIRALKNPQKAKVLAGFFKTGKGQYGEGDVFLGVMVPEIRVLVAKHAQMHLDEVAVLLQSKFHEERLSALLIMVAQYKAGNEKAKKQIFNTYLKNTKQINSWDLVDLSADHIVGAYLAEKPKKILFKLADSKLLWERRIAMLATFFDIKHGKSEMALLIAEKLLNDKEDLMHKAVGWMLREVGKRCSQEEEEKFLEKYSQKMSRTTLRYAIERFEEGKRQQYLGKK